LITLTEGAPREAGYTVLTLLLVLMPILSVVVLSRSRKSGGQLNDHVKGKESEEQRKIDDSSSTGTVTTLMPIIGNIVLLGFVCWAIIDQYPHPEEPGVLEYEILAILTPILSVVAIVRSGAGKGWLSLHTQGK
jgi:hypothetical protein